MKNAIFLHIFCLLSGKNPIFGVKMTPIYGLQTPIWYPLDPPQKGGIWGRKDPIFGKNGKKPGPMTIFWHLIGYFRKMGLGQWHFCPFWPPLFFLPRGAPRESEKMALFPTQIPKQNFQNFRKFALFWPPLDPQTPFLGVQRHGGAKVITNGAKNRFRSYMLLLRLLSVQWKGLKRDKTDPFCQLIPYKIHRKDYGFKSSPTAPRTGFAAICFCLCMDVQWKGLKSGINRPPLAVKSHTKSIEKTMDLSHHQRRQEPVSQLYVFCLVF